MRRMISSIIIFTLILVLASDAIAKDALIGMDRFKNLKKLGTVKPRSSDKIHASGWGLQFNKWDLPEELMLKFMGESGVKWARVETRSYWLSPEEGYYNFKGLDKIINGLTKLKITTFITFADRHLKLKDDDLTETKAAAEWLEGVKILVKRYGKQVKHWEILNEPKCSIGYSRLIIAASKAIKKIDPKAKILAGSLARVNVIGLKTLIDNGVGPFIDVVTYHPYNEFPEANKYPWLVPVKASEEGGYMKGGNLVEELREQLKRADHPIELWQGECGYPSAEYTTSWKGRGPWGENIQAKWILRRFLVDFSMDIPVNIYFLLREPPEEGKMNAKGLLYLNTWKPKQGYRTLQNLTSVFDQRLGRAKKIKSEFEILDEGGFSGIIGENKGKKKKAHTGAKSPYPIEVTGMTGSGGDAVVYWLPWRMQEYVKPAKVNMQAKNVRIKKPVLVDLFTGNVFRIQAKARNDGMFFEGLLLTDYPMAIVAEDLVKLK